MLKIISHKDINELSKAAVGILAEKINVLLKTQKYVILGISGGRSVKMIFELLKDEKRINWKKVHIFMADERWVPISHEDSNYRLAKETFIDYLIDKKKLPKKNTHPFLIHENDELSMGQYEGELKALSDEYDIAIFGAGEDGHVASLYPAHSSLNDDYDYFIKVEDSPKPPKKRLSMSRKMILKTKTAFVLFTGEGKKHAYYYFKRNEDFRSCPAKLVKFVKDAYVFTDLE